MCYLVREQQAREPAATAVPPPGPERMRPRRAGVLAFGMIAGLAIAALVAPSPTARTPDVQFRQAAAAPVATHAAKPVPVTLEKMMLSGDDAVPSFAGKEFKAGIGPCEHDL